MQNTHEKANLQKTKVYATKITKVHADRNKFCTGKNGGNKPNSLAVGRLLWSVSEMKFLAVLKFDNFDSKGHLSYLNGFMVLIPSYQ